jgi:hypothetical protein
MCISSMKIIKIGQETETEIQGSVSISSMKIIKVARKPKLKYKDQSV